MNDLAEHIYELIVAYYLMNNKSGWAEWEAANGESIKKAIRQLLQSTFDPQPFSEPFPLPPPPNELYHIGDGVMVEVDNPEVNCEVIE